MNNIISSSPGVKNKLRPNSKHKGLFLTPKCIKTTVLKDFEIMEYLPTTKYNILIFYFMKLRFILSKTNITIHLVRKLGN